MSVRIQTSYEFYERKGLSFEEIKHMLEIEAAAERRKDEAEKRKDEAERRKDEAEKQLRNSAGLISGFLLFPILFYFFALLTALKPSCLF